MLLSKCALCDNEKSKHVKKQEASVLLSNLGVITPLIKIQWLGIFFFIFRDVKWMKWWARFCGRR